MGTKASPPHLSFTFSAAKYNRCQPAKPSGCSLVFVLSFCIVLFHPSTCRSLSLPGINSCTVKTHLTFKRQTTFFPPKQPFQARKWKACSALLQQLMRSFKGRSVSHRLFAAALVLERGLLCSGVWCNEERQWTHLSCCWSLSSGWLWPSGSVTCCYLL